MSYADHRAFESIERKLLLNKQGREKRGALLQDFECLPGEIFFGNLKQAEFDALPLRTKRKGSPARAVRIFSEKTRDNVNRVFEATYEKLYNDKESFTVFLHTYELNMLGIAH